MKKLLALYLCCSLMFSGCSFFKAIEPYLPPEETEKQEDDKPHKRVYMDELIGTLVNFDGSQLVLKSDDNNIYSFNVSQATIECSDGIVSGDEISVIYEGQMEYGDTSSVNVLKVADAFHEKAPLKDNILKGQIQACSFNSMTIKTSDGKEIQLAITGSRQYYQSGLKVGGNVHVHYKGNLPEETADNFLNAAHLKVLSVSDIDPLVLPTPTPLPNDSTEIKKAKKFSAKIQNASNGILQIRVNSSKNVLKLDLSSTKCYFRGGIAPGTTIFVTYEGDFDKATTDGIEILQIISENTENLSDKKIESYIKGTIVGSTQNTITLQTNDGILLTCNTENAINATSSGLVSGALVKVYFNPSNSKKTNIFYGIKIEDA